MREDKVLEFCADCEKVFLAGKNERICPECRKKRLSYYAKQRNLSKIGNRAYSEKRALAKKHMEADGDV